MEDWRYLGLVCSAVGLCLQRYRPVHAPYMVEMNIDEAVEKLERMQGEMLEINVMLKPMARRDVGRRDEPAWNAHSRSGHLYCALGELRREIGKAVKEITS